MPRRGTRLGQPCGKNLQYVAMYFSGLIGCHLDTRRKDRERTRRAFPAWRSCYHGPDVESDLFASLAHHMPPCSRRKSSRRLCNIASIAFVPSGALAVVSICGRKYRTERIGSASVFCKRVCNTPISTTRGSISLKASRTRRINRSKSFPERKSESETE